MANTNAIETYKAARRSGLDTVDAANVVRDLCGVSFDEAVSLVWAVEERRAVPAWAKSGAELSAAEAAELATYLKGYEP